MRSLFCLFSFSCAQEQQHAEQQRCADQPGDVHILHEACDDEADKADDRDGERIGKLRGNMVKMLTLRTGGGHDGRVGDGGAVVAAHGARAAGGDADDEQLAVSREDGGNDRDQNAKRAPACAGGKGQNAGHDENDGGQHTVQPRRSGVHQIVDIYIRAKGVDHGLQRDGQRQDDDRRDHGNKALGHAGHGLLEGQNLPRDEINNRQHQRDDTAPRQTDEGVRIAEGADKIARERRIAGHIGAEEAADIDHADRAGHDQRQHRENEVDHAPVRVGRFTGFLHQRRQIALRGLGLKFAHGAVIELHGDDCENEHEGQNGIEVIGNGLDEQLNAAHAGVEALGRGGNCRRPGRDRRDHAHGSRRGVDQIRQLGTGNFVAVRDRAHDGTDGQAVKVIVNENQNAEHERRQLRACVRLDVRLGPAAKGSRAARCVDQRDNNAQQHEEQENARVGGDRGDQTVIQDGVERRDGRKAAGEQAADQNADEQRAVGFLCDKCQHDRDDRRQQRPGRVCKRCAVCALDRRDDEQRQNDDCDELGQDRFGSGCFGFHGSHS